MFLQAELRRCQWQTGQKDYLAHLPHKSFISASRCEAVFLQQLNITDSDHVLPRVHVHPTALNKKQELCSPFPICIHTVISTTYVLCYLFQTTSVFQNKFEVQPYLLPCVLYYTASLSYVQTLKYCIIPDPGEILAQIYLSFSVEVWFSSQLYNFTVVSIRLLP